MAAWVQLSTPATESAAETPEHASQTRTAVEAFERARRQGGDVDALISKLQGDLEIGDLDEGAAEDELAPAPDFPGVVGAMIEEFLWETGLSDEAERDRFSSLQSLGEFSKKIGVFDEFGASDLLQFTTFWIHEQGLLQSPRAVDDLIAALGAFCRWAQEQQELPLLDAFGATLEGLRDSLPNIVALNVRLATAPNKEPLGELFEVQRSPEKDAIELVDRAGNVHTTIEFPAALRASLRGGEFVRADIDVLGRVTPYRFYPPQASGLLGG